MVEKRAKDDSNKIKKILIVGGGTSGWLTAGFLNKALGDSIKITLLESSDVGTIGVGEATVPTLRTTMEYIGFKEDEWLPEVNGTFKSAIKFVNWDHNPEKDNDHYYWHPFAERPEVMAHPYDSPWFIAFGHGVSLFHYALKKRLLGDSNPIVGMYNPLVSLCENKQSPKRLTEKESGIRTAYHMDAGLLTQFLRKKLTARGINNIIDHMVNINKNDEGFIQSITTKGGQTIDADLFIDCTGFKGLLINESMGAPFESHNDSLLCNSAVAISSKNNPEADGISPYTTATALSSGWIWDIPLFNRSGCGYVYSDEFINKEQAETELREFLGDRCNDSKANHIKMRVGKTLTPWVKNCVAIGLSSCFIEPLESTGIMLTELGAALLVSQFPDKSFNQGQIDTYNNMIRKSYDEVKDFIIMHYVLSKRNDTPFWRAVQSKTFVPDSLKMKMDGFSGSLPTLDSIQVDVFPASSYVAVLDGYGHIPKEPYPLLEQIGYEHGNKILDESQKRVEYFVNNMPDHYEYIKCLYEEHRQKTKTAA